jgi:hypothetical protein
VISYGFSELTYHIFLSVIEFIEGRAYIFYGFNLKFPLFSLISLLINQDHFSNILNTNIFFLVYFSVILEIYLKFFFFLNFEAQLTTISS